MKQGKILSLALIFHTDGEEEAWSVPHRAEPAARSCDMADRKDRARAEGGHKGLAEGSQHSGHNTSVGHNSSVEAREVSPGPRGNSL